jgi:glutamate formiminotransferase/formiminotetrahydrofolate cyclodeaminase
MGWIECVPNFSEGRDPAVIDAIVQAMLALPGVYLLEREMDADHNRAVVTLAGEAAAVAEAAVRGVGAAAERIDLRRHRGAHPRIGATDVVPFVPLEGTRLEECVRLAEWAGAEIWQRYRIPVYLYEAAARRPERRGLEAVRKGQFEGLAEEVRTNPERAPDFGLPFPECRLHESAGATVVGARRFLIAYNINLETGRLDTAKAIARAIRASSGGLPAVKAMGVALHDPERAQVSMNLTDYETTSLATVWRAVESLAAEHGTRIAESELVGLIPRAALEGAAAEMLGFASFAPDRVVEARLEQVRAALPTRHGATLQPFLDALASEEPAPGGGSAAAAAGAMAAALGRMVAQLARARALKTQGVAPPVWAEAEAELHALERELARAVDEDSESFLAIRAARRLPKATAGEQQVRAAAIAASTVLAAEVPLGVAARCLRVRERLLAFQAQVPAAMASDVSTALALALAGWQGAHDNVAINLQGLAADAEPHRRIAAALAQLKP